MRDILLEAKKRILWSLRQMFTVRHIIASIIFVFYFTCGASEIPIEKLLVCIVFIIFCCYKNISYMIAGGIIVGILLAVFPFFAFLVPLFVIVGIVSKAKFFWQNKYTMYLGMTVVLMPTEIPERLWGNIFDIISRPVVYIINLISRCHEHSFL